MKNIKIVPAFESFEPFEVRFTVESIEELNEMWVRLNLAQGVLREHRKACWSYSLNKELYIPQSSCSIEIWERLNEKLIKLHEGK